MIKVTPEMVEAYDDAAWEHPVELGGLEMANIRAGLAAVLAIVERDYRVEPRPSWELPDGRLRCAKHPSGCELEP